MGVDYESNFGIGVQLVNLNFNESVDYDNMYDYLEDKLKEVDGIDIFYFEIGDYSYSEVENCFFICIKNPLSEGVEELEYKVNILYKYLYDNKIEFIGEIDIVGGIHTY